MSSPPRTPSPMAMKLTEDERHELLLRLVDENRQLTNENRQLRTMLRQKVSTTTSASSSNEGAAAEEGGNEPPATEGLVPPEPIFDLDASDDFESKVKRFIDRHMGPEGQYQQQDQTSEKMIGSVGALSGSLSIGMLPLQESMESLVLASTNVCTGAALGSSSTSVSLNCLDAGGINSMSKLSVSVRNAHLYDNNLNAVLTSLPPAYALADCNNRTTYLATNSLYPRAKPAAKSAGREPKPASTNSAGESDNSSSGVPTSSEEDNADNSSTSTLRASASTPHLMLFDIDDYMRRKEKEVSEVYKIQFDDDKPNPNGSIGKATKNKSSLDRKSSKGSANFESGVDSYDDEEEEDDDPIGQVESSHDSDMDRVMNSLDQHKWFVLPNEAATSHELVFSRLQQELPCTNTQATYRTLLKLWRTTRQSVSRLNFLYHVLDFLCEKYMTVIFCNCHNPPCSPRVDGSTFRKLAVPIIKSFLQSANISRQIIVQVEILTAIESLAYNKPKLRPAVADIFDTLFTSGVIEAIAFSEWSSLEDPSSFFPMTPERNGCGATVVDGAAPLATSLTSGSISSLEAIETSSSSSSSSSKADRSRLKRYRKSSQTNTSPPATPNGVGNAFLKVSEAVGNKPTNRSRLFQELHKAGFTLLKKSYSLA